MNSEVYMKKPYNKVTKRLTKKDVLTVPNLLSLIRILMIPVIIWLYLTDRMIAAVCVLAASMATDLSDCAPIQYDIRFGQVFGPPGG